MFIGYDERDRILIKYLSRSVLSLLLTLIFLSLGIACLTVLYLVVKMRGSSSRGRPRQMPHVCDSVTNKVTGMVRYWTRLTQYKKNKLVDDFSDDEAI